MYVRINELLWDSTTFDNNYYDIMPLVESIRKHGLLEDNPIVVTPLGDRYLVVSGRDLARAAAMLGIKRIIAIVRDNMSEMDIMMARIKETEWKEGFHEGRNHHAFREGY